MNIIEQLKEFIEKNNFPANKWLDDDKMKLYVRIGYHMIPVDYFGKTKRAKTLDLASFEVFEQQQGTFSEVLQAAHDMNPFDATYIENVLNPHLPASLLKRGYMPHGQSFYKWKKLPEINHLLRTDEGDSTTRDVIF